MGHRDPLLHQRAAGRLQVDAFQRGAAGQHADVLVQGAGARLLMLDLAAPLTDAERIEMRLDLVALFERDGAMRERLRPFGGEVNISASPGYPAVIALHVPAARA